MLRHEEGILLGHVKFDVPKGFSRLHQDTRLTTSHPQPTSDSTQHSDQLTWWMSSFERFQMGRTPRETFVQFNVFSWQQFRSPVFEVSCISTPAMPQILQALVNWRFTRNLHGKRGVQMSCIFISTIARKIRLVYFASILYIFQGWVILLLSLAYLYTRSSSSTTHFYLFLLRYESASS